MHFEVSRERHELEEYRSMPYRFANGDLAIGCTLDTTRQVSCRMVHTDGLRDRQMTWQASDILANETGVQMCYLYCSVFDPILGVAD